MYNSPKRTFRYDMAWHSSLLKLPTTLTFKKNEVQSCSRLSVPLHPGPIMRTGSEPLVDFCFREKRVALMNQQKLSDLEKWIKEVANASLSFTQIQMQQISMRYLRKYKLTKWQCVEGTAFFTETAFLSTQIIKLFVRISCSTRHWTGIASVSWYLWN